MNHAIVIGAGIGGLTAALALAARGWEVEVVERAPALLEVGSSIVLPPNALRALDTLPGGIAEELAGLAPVVHLGGMRTTGGRWLIRQDLAALRERQGYPMVPVPRSVLIDMLASRLPGGALRLGGEVAHVETGAGAMTLVSGEELRADLVVAADGIHSPVRRAIFPDFPAPVFAGASTWLMTAPDLGTTVLPGETWGEGRMFGLMPLHGGGYYAFGEVAAARPTPPRSPAEEHARLIETFEDFPAPIPRIIASVDPHRIVRVDVHCLARPLPAFHRGRVALLGDAAHAMTPNLGQGAGQAIEDAVTLGAVAPDLARYTALRLPRTRAVMRGSRLMTRLAMSTGIAAAIRDAGLRTMTAVAPQVETGRVNAMLGWMPPNPAPVALPVAERMS